MKKSPFWEANRSSANQGPPRISWDTEVQCRIHKSPSPVPILSQINLVHAPKPTSRWSLLISSSHLCLSLSSGIFPSGLPTKTLHAPLHSHIGSHVPPVSCFDHPNKIGKECRSQSSSLCSLLHSPLTSSLLDPNVFLSTPFPTLSAYVGPSMCDINFHSQTK